MSQVPAPAPHDRVMNRILQLTLEHMVAYRLEIGRLILDEFFDGDAAKFHDRSRFKPTRFRDFVSAHGPRLQELGMGESTLRQCVTAHLIIADLAPATRARLTFTHLVALATVKDVPSRRLLADAAVQEGWTVAELQAASERVQEGQWVDQDPEKAGLQPQPLPPRPKPKPPTRPLTTRRDQTREVRRVRGELKRTEKALDGVIGGLQALQAGGWASPGEREALRALIDEVKRRIEQIGQGVG